MSAQYGAALSNFDEPDADGRPLRFRWGFIASSDNHSGRARHRLQAVRAPRDDATPAAPTPKRSPRRISRIAQRQPGGSAARHRGDPRPARLPGPVRRRARRELHVPGRTGRRALPTGRDRRAIWNALERREVYATSGPAHPALVRSAERPGRPAPDGERGRARRGAALPGARDRLLRAAGRAAPRRASRPSRPSASPICATASATTRATSATASTRSRSCASGPQAAARRSGRAADRGSLAQLRLPAGPRRLRRSSSTTRSSRGSGRDAVYYVRALQEPTPAVNGANLRTRVRRAGQRDRGRRPATATPARRPTTTAWRPVAERAWSSPIYVDHARL